MAVNETTTKILCFDVWGGEMSCEHVARQYCDIDDPAWQMRLMRELREGFLVNVRMLGPEEGWGRNEDFDARLGSAGVAHA